MPRGCTVRNHTRVSRPQALWTSARRQSFEESWVGVENGSERLGVDHADFRVEAGTGRVGRQATRPATRPGVEDGLCIAVRVEQLAPLVLARPGGRVRIDEVARVVVGSQGVAQVVPGDQGDHGVDPEVDRRQRKLEATAVRPTPGAHPRVIGAVLDDVVSSRDEVDHVGGSPAIPLGRVDLDGAAAASEAEPRVGEDQVAVAREEVGLGGLVILAAAEAVGGQNGRDGR